VRRSERRELPLGRADARVPRRSDRRERAPEGLLDAAVEPLDAARLEERAARLDRRDRDPRVLQPAQDLLPFALGSLRVGLDEDERRAERERLPEPHSRTDSGGLGGRSDGPDQRLDPLGRRERRRPESEPRATP
jgi:hypothetical protein